MGAGDTCPETSRRLFVRDKASGIRFLIDTGADISVFPRKLFPGQLKKSEVRVFRSQWDAHSDVRYANNDTEPGIAARLLLAFPDSRRLETQPRCTT
jgi:hypothetical protein